MVDCQMGIAHTQKHGAMRTTHSPVFLCLTTNCSEVVPAGLLYRVTNLEEGWQLEYDDYQVLTLSESLILGRSQSRECS